VARVLAVDIGTSSVRAALYGQSLRPVRPGTHLHYRWQVSRDGSVEAASATIERAVAQAIDGALQGVTRRVDAAPWHRRSTARSKG